MSADPLEVRPRAGCEPGTADARAGRTADEDVSVAASRLSASPRHGDGRHALLVAAVHVVATRGLRGLTYRAVANEAGVAHTLVAHHFGSRRALLREALMFSLERTLPTVSDRPGSGDPTAFLANLASLTEREPDDQALFFTLTLEARNDEGIKELIEQVYDTFQAAIATELIAMGFAPDDAMTHLLLAAADGLLFQQLCLGRKDRTQPSVQRLRDLLATALKYRSADSTKPDVPGDSKPGIPRSFGP